MFKQAWYTYWKSLHPRNLKRLENKAFGLVILFLYVIIPVLLTGVSDNIDTLYTFTKFIPLFVLKVSDIDNGIRLQKAIYLTPMQKEERQNYINALLAIKIGVVVILAIVLDLLWGIAYGSGIKDVVTNTIIYGSIGIANCVGVGIIGKDIKEATKTMQKIGQEQAGWNLANDMVGILLILGFVPVNTGIYADYLFGIHPVVLAGCIFLLFADYKIMKVNYQTMLRAAGEYEINVMSKGVKL